jgi:hypothetical protein
VQAPLVGTGVGQNIKTVNGTTLLGSGNVGTAFSDITGTVASNTALSTALGGKQDTLVSLTNIRTVQGNTLLGNTDISRNAILPSVSSGQFLQWDGSNWIGATAGGSGGSPEPASDGYFLRRRQSGTTYTWDAGLPLSGGVLNGNISFSQNNALISMPTGAGSGIRTSYVIADTLSNPAMDGPPEIESAPTTAMQIANKGYVDANAGGGGIDWTDQEQNTGLRFRVGAVDQPIYRKTVALGRLPAANQAVVYQHNIINLGLVTHMYGSAVTSIGTTIPIPNVDQGNAGHIGVIVRTADLTIAVQADRSTMYGWLTLEYIKAIPWQ